MLTSNLTMSTDQQTKANTDLSKLSEQEQLIFLFYYFEVSIHPFINDKQIGSSRHHQILSRIVSLTPKVPFPIPRQTFLRKAKEMKVTAAQVKATGSDPTVNLFPTMKKKSDQIKSAASATTYLETPQTMYLSSTFPVQKWQNEGLWMS